MTESKFAPAVTLLTPEQIKEADGLVAKTIGAAIRDRREALGLTQNQLGERVGVDGSSISGWERGVAQVTAVRLFAIATALDTKVAALFPGFTGNPFYRPVPTPAPVDPTPAQPVRNPDTEIAVDMLRSALRLLERTR